MNYSINFKKIFYVLVTMLAMMCMSIVPAQAAAGRKLITKNVKSTQYWSTYTITYSVNATAGLTYNNSNNITAISDLSFSGHSYTVNPVASGGVTCTLTTRQKSKTYSGTTATYVMTLTRNVMGVYVDNVDYTLTYRTSDAGTPYSLEKDEFLVLVDVEEGEPYNIQILE
ncbi:hypothetical protein [Floccifex porci]|uniref:Uncharacterized protein n=1 Tax=Floccifex porci TaxID=2606629 RepID=A0A7X2N3V2_9FIRM|nr:hypothetical protein [Floccifex porci]MSS01975.1 hypothetical protein [Floccifex porci]